jgi:hypothetical protein
LLDCSTERSRDKICAVAVKIISVWVAGIGALESRVRRCVGNSGARENVGGEFKGQGQNSTQIRRPLFYIVQAVFIVNNSETL